jgi:ParB family chromosome partitioning protein
VNAPEEKRGAFRGRGGLGRGLDALFSSGSPPVEQVAATPEPAAARTAPSTVDIDLIAPNPRQPRTAIDAEALAALVDSVRQHGLIQPLVVSRRATASGGAAYVLIAGERRLQAARAAGLNRVPVVVREATPQQQLELALVENIQRADLNPLEEAAAFQHLQREFGLTQEALAERIGRSRVAVTNTLRLLALPDSIKQSLAANEISEGHARALLGLPDAAQTALWRQVVEKGLSVRQTEALARALREAAPGATTKPAPRRPDPDAAALVERLERALGTGVQINRGRNGGKLVIRFYSDDELDALVQMLAGEE